MIEIRNLTVVNEGRAVLNGINATIRSGEVTVAVGPNGAGKSALLKAICGESAFASGDVMIENLSVLCWPAKKLSVKRAVVPEELDPGLNMTVREVAALGRLSTAAWCPRGVHEAVVMKALELAGVAWLARTPYSRISRAEQQRVQLARAMARVLDSCTGDDRTGGLKYLMLDEPTNGLDFTQQHALMKVSRSMAARGCSVFCILHDLSLAATYADHVLVMEGGRLVADGPPKVSLSSSVLRRAYGVDVLRTRHPKVPYPLFVMPDSPARALC